MQEEAAQINATRGYNDYAPNPNSATYTPADECLAALAVDHQANRHQRSRFWR